MRPRGAATAIFLLALVFGLGLYVARGNFSVGKSGKDKVAMCVGGGVRLDQDQMSNAATIAAVGTRRGLPDQAIVVAIAASLQEAKLRNLDHLGRRNDHDSLGLFQQRPSQGWGTEEEILDQRLATENFFNALVDVDGWEQMRVTDAAQQVQRSAYPEAYEKWADEARTLTEALRGHDAGAVTCSTPPPVATKVGAVHTAELIRKDFGARAPKMTTDAGRLRIAVADQQAGWQMAHWLVAQADVTGVTRVSYGDKQWSAQHGAWSAIAAADQVATSQVMAEVLPAK